MHPASPPRPQPLGTGTSPAGGVDVSVIIVNYNVCEFLEQALRSVVRAAAGLKVEIFVVDNNSIDGSVAMVRSRFPDVRLIVNEENAGFSRANDQAIRQAHGRYLFILNPDTIVREDTLQVLVAFMDAHPDAGAAGCKILNPDGTFAPESRRSFPTPAVAFYRITGLSRLFPRSRRFGRYNLSYLSPDETTEVDALSGSCMFIRHEALLRRADGPNPAWHNGQAPCDYAGAGLFDEDFFMYGEDLDWCYRIQQAGWNIYYTPDTEIIHYKGESTKKGELRYVLLFYGAMLRFAEKHFRGRYSGLFRAVLRAGIVVRGGLHVLANGVRRLAGPLGDAGVVLGAVALAGWLRFRFGGLAFPSLFLLLVTPLYMLLTLLGISMRGGYSYRHRNRLMPVIQGSAFAFLGMAALSFFARGIAFSRLALLAGFVLSTIGLCLLRLARAYRDRTVTLFRRAVLVGDRQEAARLEQSLDPGALPAVKLVGYIGEDDASGGDVPCLGPMRQLRDVVRLRGIDDVIFASSVLSNRTIFDLIQQLHDLPVSFKILSPGLEHMIGPARVDDLAGRPALVDAERALGIRRRSPFARRAFEVTIALAGLVLHPAVALMARRTGPASARWQALATRTRRLHTVLLGRRALVGYRDDEATFIGASWHLKPGVFTITDTLPAGDARSQDISRAYWLYARNQSLTLDLDIILRTIKQASAHPSA